jgi:hypothetical protein
MLAFYLDHHIHRAIADGLRHRGIDILTAFEDGMATSDDEVLFERATSLGRIFVTQDQDFLEIAARWQHAGRAFPGLVYGIQQRLNIGKCIEYLVLIASVMLHEDMQNRIEFIPQ